MEGIAAQRQHGCGVILRRHAFLLLALVFFAAAFFGWRNLREERVLDTRSGLLNRLPTQDAVVLSVDFAALRSAGVLNLLSGSKAAEEPEYAEFVRNSNFDYKKDLDSALVAFAPDGIFFLIRGRFDWPKLAAYAKRQGGSCYNQLCRMTGSRPERRISFLPLRPDLMGLAVANDDLAASRLQQASPQRAIKAPAQPAWVSVPSKALKDRAALPGAAHLFTSALADADLVTVSLGPEGREFAARLEAQCRSAESAARLVAQLQKTTAVLRDVSTREKNDLGVVLGGGTFQPVASTVLGHWTVRKSFLENLASGL